MNLYRAKPSDEPNAAPKDFAQIAEKNRPCVVSNANWLNRSIHAVCIAVLFNKTFSKTPPGYLSV